MTKVAAPYVDVCKQCSVGIDLTQPGSARITSEHGDFCSMECADHYELTHEQTDDDPRLISHRNHIRVTPLREPTLSLVALDEHDDDDDQDDRRETRERARTVVSILERCSEELARLELVPTSDAEDVNTLSAAKGFCARARNLLRGRFA